MTNSYLLNMTDTNNITNNFIFLHFDLVISTAEGKKGKILDKYFTAFINVLTGF